MSKMSEVKVRLRGMTYCGLFSGIGQKCVSFQTAI